MSTVEIYVPMRVPAARAHEVMAEILRRLSEGEEPYERTALSLGLRDLRLPLEGEISVPVKADVEVRPLRWEADLTLAAKSGSALFPRFRGTLAVTPDGSSASGLWLQGAYDVPLGWFGRAVDMTLLRGVAESSLKRFAEWLARTIVDRIERSEQERAREGRTRAD